MKKTVYLPPKLPTAPVQPVPEGKIVVVTTETMTGEEMVAWVPEPTDLTPGWLMLHYLAEMREHEQECDAVYGAPHNSSLVTMMAGGDDMGVVWATLRDANPFLSCMVFIHAYKPRR